MASAKSRFVQGQALSTSLTLLGKVETIRGEGTSQRFRSIAPWCPQEGNTSAWMQKFMQIFGHVVDPSKLSITRMRKQNIRAVLVGEDGIRRIVFAEPKFADPKLDGLKSIGIREGRVVEVVFSFTELA